MRTRPVATLLSMCVALGACRDERRVKPVLPESVSPGWKLKSLDASSVPPFLPYPSSRLPSKQAQAEGLETPATGSPDCWQANYAGTGTAHIRLCRFSGEPGAFDAVQRARLEAQTVKFQQDEYLVLVKWENTPKVDLAALMHAIQQALVGK